jgi:hypothetical protein
MVKSNKGIKSNKKVKSNKKIKKYKRVNTKKRGGELNGAGALKQMGQNLQQTSQVIGLGTTQTILTSSKVALGTTVKSVHAVGAVLEGVLVTVTAIFETLTALCISLPHDFTSIVRVYIGSNNEQVKKMCIKKLEAIFKKIIKITENSFELTFKEYKGFNTRLINEVKLNMETVGCKQTFFNRQFRSSFNFSGKGCPDILKKVQELLNLISIKLKEIYEKLKTNRSSIRNINQTEYSSLIKEISGKPTNTYLLEFMDKYKNQIDPIILNSKILVSPKRDGKKVDEKKEDDIHDLITKLKEELKEIYNEKHPPKLTNGTPPQVSPDVSPQTESEISSEVVKEVPINKKGITNKIKGAFSVNSRKLNNYKPTNNMSNNKGTNAINTELISNAQVPVATPVSTEGSVSDQAPLANARVA